MKTRAASHWRPSASARRFPRDSARLSAAIRAPSPFSSGPSVAVDAIAVGDAPNGPFGLPDGRGGSPPIAGGRPSVVPRFERRPGGPKALTVVLSGRGPPVWSVAGTRARSSSPEWLKAGQVCRHPNSPRNLSAKVGAQSPATLACRPFSLFTCPRFIQHVVSRKLCFPPRTAPRLRRCSQRKLECYPAGFIRWRTARPGGAPTDDEISHRPRFPRQTWKKKKKRDQGSPASSASSRPAPFAILISSSASSAITSATTSLDLDRQLGSTVRQNRRVSVIPASNQALQQSSLTTRKRRSLREFGIPHELDKASCAPRFWPQFRRFYIVHHHTEALGGYRRSTPGPICSAKRASTRLEDTHSSSPTSEPSRRSVRPIRLREPRAHHRCRLHDMKERRQTARSFIRLPASPPKEKRKNKAPPSKALSPFN